MPLETGTLISDLIVTNPAHADGLNQADAHIRLLKAALKNTFPNINSAVSLTDEQLNALLVAFTAPDGSAAAPTHNFASEPTLGLYRIAAGILGFTGRLRGNGAIDPGFMLDFGGTTAPSGWLVCDGQAVSRTTYADLYNAIGTTWGGGDGSTTFNLPNLISRYRRHRDAGTGLPVLGGGVGNYQSPVNLTHSHAVGGTSNAANADHSHAFSGTTGGMNANATHTHGITSGGRFASTGSSAGAVASGGAFNTLVGLPTLITPDYANIDHGHAFSGQTGGMSNSHAHDINLTSAASGDANEARPYSATVLTCIKT